MTEAFYFNSMQLAMELHVAGEFLYDGLHELYSLLEDGHSFESRVFSAYYQITVGIERMQKVILVLNINASAEDDLVKNKHSRNLLHGHSCIALANEIEKRYPDAAPSKDQRRLLHNLADFYKDCRYGYYHFENGNDRVTMHLIEFARLKNDYECAHFMEQTQMQSEAIKELAENVGEIIQMYVDLIRQAKEPYYTDETESSSKFAVIKYYAHDVMGFFQLRRLAMLELAAFLADTKDCIDFVDAVDVSSFIRGLSCDETCSALVDNLTEYYLNERDMSLHEEKTFVEDRIDELSYLLSPDPEWEAHLASIQQDDCRSDA